MVKFFSLIVLNCLIAVPLFSMENNSGNARDLANKNFQAASNLEANPTQRVRALYKGRFFYEKANNEVLNYIERQQNSDISKKD